MGDSLIDIAAKKMVDHSTSIYDSHKERSAMRCEAGDAAALCDAVGRWIGEQHKKHGGGVTKRGLELQAIAKLCGDEIWKMRNLVKHPHTTNAEDGR